MLWWMVASAVASGPVYDITLDVPSARPSGFADHEKVVTFATAMGVAPGTADVEVVSDYAPVVCDLQNGDLFVTFESTASTLPSSYPPMATCTAQGHTLRVHLNPRVLNGRNEMRLRVDAQTGVHVDLATTGDPLGYVASVRLPDGSAYAHQERFAMLADGTRWHGVVCEPNTHPSGREQMWLTVRRSAVAGTGFCRLEDLAGQEHLMPVEILR